MTLGSDDQHPPIRAGADERVGDLERGEEPRALHPNVEGVRTVEAELPGEQPAVAREVVVRRHRREDDEVEVLRLEARVRERASRRLDSQGRGGVPLAGVAALPDAGALPDPLVARIHEERHPLVGDDSGRNVHSGTADDRGDRAHVRGREGSPRLRSDRRPAPPRHRGPSLPKAPGRSGRFAPRPLPVAEGPSPPEPPGSRRRRPGAGRSRRCCRCSAMTVTVPAAPRLKKRRLVRRVAVCGSPIDERLTARRDDPVGLDRLREGGEVPLLLRAPRSGETMRPERPTRVPACPGRRHAEERIEDVRDR